MWIMFIWCTNKKPPTNWIKTIKNPKISLVRNFWKIDEKFMNACNISKKEGQKSLSRCLGEKPLKLWLNKDQKKKRLRGIERGIEEDDKKKKNEEQGSDSSYFFLKNDFRSVKRKWARNWKYFKNRFDWTEGIEGGIESTREF